MLLYFMKKTEQLQAVSASVTTLCFSLLQLVIIKVISFIGLIQCD